MPWWNGGGGDSNFKGQGLEVGNLHDERDCGGLFGSPALGKGWQGLVGEGNQRERGRERRAGAFQEKEVNSSSSDKEVRILCGRPREYSQTPRCVFWTF